MPHVGDSRALAACLGLEFYRSVAVLVTGSPLDLGSDERIGKCVKGNNRSTLHTSSSFLRRSVPYVRLSDRISSLP